MSAERRVGDKSLRASRRHACLRAAHVSWENTCAPLGEVRPRMVSSCPEGCAGGTVLMLECNEPSEVLDKVERA